MGRLAIRTVIKMIKSVAGLILKSPKASKEQKLVAGKIMRNADKAWEHHVEEE